MRFDISLESMKKQVFMSLHFVPLRLCGSLFSLFGSDDAGIEE